MGLGDGEGSGRHHDFFLGGEGCGVGWHVLRVLGAWA